MRDSGLLLFLGGRGRTRGEGCRLSGLKFNEKRMIIMSLFSKSSNVLPTHFLPSNICEHVPYLKLLKKYLPWAYESVTPRARPTPTDPLHPADTHKSSSFSPPPPPFRRETNVREEKKEPALLLLPPLSTPVFFFLFFSPQVSVQLLLLFQPLIVPRGTGGGGEEQEPNSDMNSLQNCVFSTAKQLLTI